MVEGLITSLCTKWEVKYRLIYTKWEVKCALVYTKWEVTYAWTWLEYPAAPKGSTNKRLQVRTEVDGGGVGLGVCLSACSF